MTTGNRRGVEWPTVALIVVAYLVPGWLVWHHESLAWWAILPGAYFVALFGSLQHEVLHGHPTGNRYLNEAMIFPTTHFWLPFGRYRATHLKHHNDADLTDPRLDPESYYLLPEAWAAMPGIKRALYRFNHTLFGRMLIGPAVTIIQFWSADFREILKGDMERARHWALFGASAAISLCYIVWLCGMPFWQYYLLLAYPGVSLALVRSYCEHRAAESADHRTIVVEASPFWSLLFLNNNLHVAHHTWPSLAWYRLPAYYRAEKDRLLARNDHYAMNGYGEIFRRFFFSAKEPIPYPNMDWLRKIEP